MEIGLSIKSLRELNLKNEDNIAVIGSSHSAMLCLKNLWELNMRPKITNFYRSELKFALYLENGTIINDNSGLKGEVAEWVNNVMPFTDI